jgi:uncharacterized protein YegJ (DUF2314 family)
MAEGNVTCSACGVRLHVDERHFGKKGKCKDCGAKFVIRPDEKPPRGGTAADALAELAATAEAAGPDSSEDRPSFMLLLSAPRELDEVTLRRTAGAALGVDFETGEETGPFIVGESPVFMVKTETGMYTLHTFPRPYWDDPAAVAADIGDPALTEAITSHRAWLSMDLIVPFEDEARAWADIGKVIAVLAGPETLAVYAPALGEVQICTPDLLAKLRGDGPPPSPTGMPDSLRWVFLLSEPIAADLQSVCDAADAAFGMDGTRGEFADCVRNDEIVGIRAKGHALTVGIHDRPYVEEASRTLEQLSDAELRAAVESSRGFVVLELVETPGGGDEAEALAHVGKLILGLTGERCVAVYNPCGERWTVCDAAFRTKLGGPDAKAALTEIPRSPMKQIDDDDPAMAAAVAEAKRRWPEFVQAFEEEGDGMLFIVKAPFSEGENTEYMWVQVTGISGDSVRGRLTNEPFNLPSYSMGDPVDVPVESLVDWAYGENGPEVGGFTIDALGNE